MDIGRAVTLTIDEVTYLLRPNTLCVIAAGSVHESGASPDYASILLLFSAICRALPLATPVTYTSPEGVATKLDILIVPALPYALGPLVFTSAIQRH
ncbi:hypothetical protein [uncultured Hymenobacter sp.]|uniref:hypothetical protein n=1 Tax=uncultured Hymenobacter sp. TaxID=170016 RepID=UPI0035C998A4